MSPSAKEAVAVAAMGVHRGCLAGLSDKARKAQIERFNAQATRADAQAALQEMMRFAINHEPEDRFSRMLMERSVEELRIMAVDYGVQNADRLGAGDLITLICAAASNDKHDCELAAEICDEEQFASLFAAIDAGGRIEFPSAQSAYSAHVRPFAPYTFLYAHEGRFTLLVTDVFKGSFAALDRAAVKRRRERCGHVVDSAAGMVDLYGMVEAHAAHELYNEYNPADALGFGEYARIVIREAMSQRYSFMCWNDGKKDYLVHYTLLGASQRSGDQSGEEEARALELARNRIIESHAKTPMKKVEHGVVCGDVFEWKKAQPQARALRAYLDEHVPDGENDYVFADRTIDELLFSLAATPDIDMAGEVLCEAGLAPFVVGDPLLADLVRSFADGLSCWDLNGWSRSEVDKLRGVE